MSSPDSGPPADRSYPELDKSEASLGQLVSDITTDLQKLLRQELALAKAEVRQEAAKAGRGAGMLGAAGFAGYMVVVLGSLAAVFGLANLMDLAWAALIIVGVWVIIAVVLLLLGRRQLQRLSPMPARTVETVKESVRWARHLTK